MLADHPCPSLRHGRTARDGRSSIPGVGSRSLLVALLVLLSLPMPSSAQTREPPITRVARVSPFVDADDPLLVVAQVVNISEVRLESVTLRVSIHPLVFSRSQLRESIDLGITSGPMISFTQTAENPIEPGDRAVLTLRRDLTAFGFVPRTGVYPVEIGITVDGDETVRRTAIPFLAAEPETHLNVSWLLPVGRPTALRADGTYSQRVLEEMQLDVLRQQMDVLAARPGTPITLLPDGSFVDALSDLADGFAMQPLEGATLEVRQGSGHAAEASAALEAMVRAAAVVGEMGSAPYTAADLSALAARGLRSDMVRQITAGRRAIEQHLRRTPSFRFFAPARFALGGLEVSTLRTLGVEGVAIDPASLPELPATPEEFPGLRYELFGVSRPILARSDADQLGALVIDADLRARLEGDEQGVLLAQSLIAETASSWLEAPLFATERLLVLSSSRLPSPPALAAVLDGLSAAPWVQMRTSSDALQLLPPSGPPAQLVRRRPPDRAFLARARQAREALDLLDEIVVDPHPRADELERFVLLAESSEWEDDPATGAALAQIPTRVVNRIVAALQVAPRVVTLTSRTGALPVTLINASDVPVRVRVRLDSPKATFPGGRARTVELRDEQLTVDFQVEALATGSFPIRVVLETVEDARPLTAGSVVLRSTAVSAVALAAVGGGALFLIIGSMRRGRRRRGTATGGRARG